jgi:hypothetical protein
VILPVRHVIDKEHRLVLTIGEGCMTFDETKRHQDTLLSDPDFDPKFDQLIDVTTATRFELSPDEAKELANRPIVSPTSRRAFVASQPAIYGWGRFMEIYHADRALVRVFYDRDEALTWLGVEPDSGHF